jgi:ATP-binding cassette, subfamily B, bacterial
MLQAPLCSALYPLLYNYAVKLLIDLFTQETHIDYHQAYLPIAWFLIAQLSLDLPWRLHNFAAWRSIPYIFQGITDKTFRYVTHHSYTFFQDHLSGAILSKIKGVGDKYFKMHNAIEYNLSSPLFTALFSGLGLLFVNKKLFCIVIIFVLINVPLSIYFCTRLSRLEQARQDSWHVLFGTISDRITNIFTLFSFASRQREAEQIQDFYKNIHNPLNFAFYRYDLIVSWVWCILYWIFLVSLFIYMIHLRNKGAIHVGDIAFTMSLSYVFAQNVWHATMSMKSFIEDYAAFKSAFSILSMPQQIIDKPTVRTLLASKGEIRFVDLCFQYQKSPAIFKNLNLSIKPHEKVAIVGHSGAGKSSLIALLLKHFLAQSGDILIDGQSLDSVSADSVRAQISVIPQDIVLFHRTIGENIAYAKEDATPQDIEQVAKMANIHDFILSLPAGYNTLVGERGVKLSGGQRQRIAIARAILKNAPILILDEATSSLDSETEQQIQKSLNTMLETNQATVIAIAHRLSTIKHMDRIIVMERGEIIEEGSFSALLHKEKGKFRALWDHQVNGLIV